VQSLDQSGRGNRLRQSPTNSLLSYDKLFRFSRQDVEPIGV
jgi:hypothetical protein